MNWIKFIILCQAVLCFFIGIFLVLDSLHNSTANQNSNTIAVDNNIKGFEEINFRFQSGGFILTIISAVELIFIFKL